MEQAEQNRSEAPTKFKLDRARRKGQVARGLDLSFLMGLVAFFGFVVLEGNASVQSLKMAMREALISGTQPADDRAIAFMVTGTIGSAIERPVLLLAGIVLTVVLLFELLQTGFVFSTENLKVDLARLNPARGLKRLVSLRLLIETGKSVLKLLAYVGVSALVLHQLLAFDIASMRDAASLGQAIARLGTRLLMFFAATAFVFAVLDQIITRRDFLKRMRMSRREVKQEHREREGEPRLKQKRRQMHAEFSRGNRSLQGLRGADMLIVNPTHIAVALRYDRATMAAPKVVSLGTNHLALRLKALALVYGVPVVEDRELARALFKGAALDRAVAPASYRRVADHYNRLRRARERS